jgi:hypothetical protein
MQLEPLFELPGLEETRREPTLNPTIKRQGFRIALIRLAPWKKLSICGKKRNTEDD